MPVFASRNAKEKIPDEAFAGCIGVSATNQLFPRSFERKTRATFAPPLANHTFFSPCSVRHELLAAKPPSFGNDGGSADGGICFQVTPPSSVINSAKWLSTGSLSTMPWRGSQNAMASKKIPG